MHGARLLELLDAKTGLARTPGAVERTSTRGDKHPMNAITRIEARSADLGEGMLVRRFLPSRQQRMVGAWCFLDHAGPVDFAPGKGMHVAGFADGHIKIHLVVHIVGLLFTQIPSNA